jgi:glycosyltransferase involved in cell wall biosynthesis
MNQPVFSVIVANYNNGRFLPDLVRSVQAQTIPDWELVIADDASTDDSASFIAPFLTDERIRWIRHTENRGAAAAFRTAMNNSHAELIGMLGADDALVPEALEKMLKAHLAHPDASMINSACLWCDESLNVIEPYRHYRPLAPGEELIRNLCIGSFATFKRASYLSTEGFDPHFRKALDHDIYLKLDEVGALYFVDEPLYLYRRNAQGISQDANGMRAAQFSAMARLNAYERRKGASKANLSDQEATTLRETWYLREMLYARLQGDRSMLSRLLREAWSRQPSLRTNKTYLSHMLRSLMM